MRSKMISSILGISVTLILKCKIVIWTTDLYANLSCGVGVVTKEMLYSKKRAELRIEPCET